IEPAVADVLDPDSLDRLTPADRAFYCVGFDRASGVAMRAVYVEGLRNALERLGGRLRRLGYASSTGVDGQGGGGWVEEGSPAEPRSESGRVVLEAEGVLRSFAEAQGLPALILRFSGLYGPGRIVRRDALEKGEAIVGDPDRYLNLIHIEDAARAVEAALERG